VLMCVIVLSFSSHHYHLAIVIFVILFLLLPLRHANFSCQVVLLVVLLVVLVVLLDVVSLDVGVVMCLFNYSSPRCSGNGE